MNYEIREIKDLTLADNEIWGNKAAYLADARKKGIPVLDGFCIAIDRGGIDRKDAHYLGDVEEHFARLRENTHARLYVARSSAQYEDKENHMFPGIFKSKENISDIEELLENIELCYASFKAEIVDRYIKEVNIKEPQQRYFCVLVQEQIEPEYSGVVSTKVPIPGYYEMDSFLIEMVEGHCQDMLQGRKKSNTYIVGRQADLEGIRRLFCATAIDMEKERDILGELTAVIKRIMEFYGSMLNIEWGYVNGKIIIFQIRPMFYRNRKVSETKEEENESIAVSSGGGLKAMAMKKFYEAGLFQKKLLLIEPGKTLDEIEHILEMESSLEGEITVRYSCGRELGLPRYFASDKRAALHFIRETYESKWAIILHESISVRDSYELYLDEKKIILEHVPGMWETDSQETTDIWIYQGQQVKAFSASCLRKARYESAYSKEYCMVEPYTEKEIQKIAAEVFPYIERAKECCPIKEGGNFHFVRDEEGKFFFLNCRKISRIQEWTEESEELTVIESKDDFAEWKGGNILLKINLKRGEEVLLKDFIPDLKRTAAKVYVRFGILSHPAILLREMGIEVYPEYTLHTKHIFTLV